MRELANSANLLIQAANPDSIRDRKIAGKKTDLLICYSRPGCKV